MACNRNPQLRLATYPIMVLLLSALLSACDSSFKPAPPPADPSVARIIINVTPDGLNTPWTLAHLSDRYEGVGDSVLTMSREGTYSLYGKTAADLVPRPFPGPLTGDVALGDSVAFELMFTQTPWRRTYHQTGAGIWYDVLPLDDGGCIVCGTQDGQARLARTDHSGKLVWDLPSLQNGSYEQILTLAHDEFLFAGQQDESVTLSCRDLSGSEVWFQSLEFSSGIALAGVTPDGHGGYFVLVTLFAAHSHAMHPVLSHLGGGGELLSQYAAATVDRVVGWSLAPRPDGGCYVLQERLAATAELSADLELVTADPDGVMTETPIFTAPLMDFDAGILPCADGGVLLTCLAPLPGGDPNIYTTRVVRLSPHGHIEWEKYIGGVTSERLTVCERSDDGSFLLAGIGWTDWRDRHTRIMRLDAGGLTISDARHHSSTGAEPELTAAHTAWDGGVFAVGSADHWDGATPDPLILRTNAFGALE